jgi:hypothetical protein
MHTFAHVYNRIKNHATIVDYEENEFILWNNSTGTCQRIALFENGLFVGNEIVARLERA